eukprot:1578132-Amphidinium_carterae.1
MFCDLGIGEAWGVDPRFLILGTSAKVSMRGLTSTILKSTAKKPKNGARDGSVIKRRASRTGNGNHKAS